jgi:hypothetical protein
MSSIDTVSLRWQRDFPENKDLRGDDWQPHYNSRFGNIDKWTHNKKGTNLPRFTWSKPQERESWLTVEFSAPYLVKGTNALDVDNADIAAVLDLVSEYASQKVGVECDARQALVGRVDYAANFAVGAELIPLYLEAALGAKVPRFCPPYRESETAVGLDTRNGVRKGGSRKIQLYDKFADVLNKVESGRLEGNAAKIALAAALDMLRLESRFKTTQTVTRLAKSLDIERTPESLLSCETAGKVIAMELKKLSLDKPIEPKSERFEALHEAFGDCKTVSDLLGFLAHRDRFGDNFYRLSQLGISKATYSRKVKLLQDAGLWLSVGSDRALPSLSEVRQVGSRKVS